MSITVRDIVPFSSARTHLSELVEQVQNGGEVGGGVVELDAAAVSAVAGGGNVECPGGGDAEEVQLPQVHLQGRYCGGRITGGGMGGEGL